MTTPVPIIRARGKLRSGLRTSGAAKVIPAQASDEKRPPTIAAPNAASRRGEKDRSAEEAIGSAEVRVKCAGVGGEQAADQNNQEQRQNLRAGENILDDTAEFEAAQIDESQERDGGDGEQTLAGKTDAAKAEPDTRIDDGEENAGETAKGDGDCGDSAGLNHQQQSPAEAESPEATVSLAQEDVLAARLRHHGGEFTVSECAGHRHEAGDEPYGEQPGG